MCVCVCVCVEIAPVERVNIRCVCVCDGHVDRLRSRGVQRVFLLARLTGHDGDALLDEASTFPSQPGI